METLMKDFLLIFGLATGVLLLCYKLRLATVVGLLTEVPFMLILVQLCKATKGTFRRELPVGTVERANNV